MVRPAVDDADREAFFLEAEVDARRLLLELREEDDDERDRDRDLDAIFLMPLFR